MVARQMTSLESSLGSPKISLLDLLDQFTEFRYLAVVTTTSAIDMPFLRRRHTVGEYPLLEHSQFTWKSPASFALLELRNAGIPVLWSQEWAEKNLIQLFSAISSEAIPNDPITLVGQLHFSGWGMWGSTRCSPRKRQTSVG
jgi:hypothetical protein